MNNVVATFIMIIIFAILGVSVGLSIQDGNKDVTIEENKKLRERLEQEVYKVNSLRLALAEERKVYEQKIKESVVKYNQLEHLHKKNEDALKSELERLGKSTVKNLEDEAERIYSAGCKH